MRVAARGEAARRVAWGANTCPHPVPVRRASCASSAWTPAVGRQGDLVVGVHGGGDPQRAVGVRDAVVAGLTDGSIAYRAGRAGPAGGPGSVVLVGGGPGDPGLITARGVKLLAEADVVVYDRAVEAVLRWARPEAERIAAGAPAEKETAQDAISMLIAEKARDGHLYGWTGCLDKLVVYMAEQEAA